MRLHKPIPRIGGKIFVKPFMKNSPNNHIDILSITSKNLREGKLRVILPEYYDLSSAVENNPAHKYQNIFDHVISVFQGLENILKFNFLNEKLRNKLDSALFEKIGSHSRREILIVATILHDIAKTLTIIKNEKTGMTACPGHELIGSYLSREMGGRFGLSGASLKHLETIVLYHGLAHDMLTLIFKKGSTEKYIQFFEPIVGRAFIEVQLLAYADMFGSDLRKIDPTEFLKREELLISSIKSSV